jgi:hypothetical protein
MVSGHPTQDRHVRKRKKTRTKGSPSPMKSLSVITLSVADMKPRLRDQLCHEEKGCHSHHVGVRTISETSFPPWVCHVSKCRIYSSIWEWLSKNPQIFFHEIVTNWCCFHVWDKPERFTWAWLAMTRLNLNITNHHGSKNVSPGRVLVLGWYN